MKTKCLAAILFIVLAITYCSRAATIQWYSQQPHTTTVPAGAIFAIESPLQTGYKYLTYNELREALGTNGASTQIITNLYVTQTFNGKTTFIGDQYVTNLYIITINTNYYLFNTNIYNNNNYVSNYFYTNVINNSVVSNAFFTNYFQTNLYLTNLTVTNYYQGNTFISNYFNTNVYNNNYVSNYYVTNLFTTQQTYNITTNLFNYDIYTNVTYMTVSNAYITNLYTTAITTNFYLYSTNVYNADTYVSNYFMTNVFNDTYVSNFFLTNQIFYNTNLYYTYVSTTNFIDYITNNYISNFWNTNIYVNNSYVSNYYVTNYNPLIQITSNYTYNVAWPMTNATLYGTTTFSPISGTVPGRISLLLGGVEAVSLVASNSSMTANTIFFRTNAWAGPTNALDLNVEDQGYGSFTACSITGLLNRSNTIVQSIVLTLTNKSSTNWLLTLPDPRWIPERTNQVAVSNASVGIISIRYHPAFGTNAVYRQF